MITIQKIKFAFFSAFLALLFALPAAAQNSAAAPKIATVDLEKICEKYYKWQLAKQVLSNDSVSLQHQLDELSDNARKTQDDYKKLRNAVDDPMISAETKQSREKQAREKLEELDNISATARDLKNQGQQKLAVEEQRLTDQLLQDIQTQVRAKAKEGNFSLVLNVSSDAFHPNAMVLYSNGDNDLTEGIIKQLNAAAPSGGGASTNAPDSSKK